MINRIDSNSKISKVVVANGQAFTSGLTATDKTVDAKAQTADILRQLDHYLAKAGTDKTRIVHVVVWLKTMELFNEMDAAWTEWINPNSAPARATVQSTMYGNTLVEIMAHAIV